ncbi:BTB/POZ protein [Aspergillus varians]
MSSRAKQTASTAAPESLIHNTMKHLFLSGEFSDMAVTCQGFTFKVHQSILCTQSSFFKAAMGGNFKEGIAHTVDLPDDSLETVERVLSFLYFNDYNTEAHEMDLSAHLKALEAAADGSGTDANGADDPDAIIPTYNHIQVYLAADKYGIPALKDFAANRFLQWCTKNWYSEDFVEAIDEAMEMIPTHDTQIPAFIATVIANNLIHLVEKGSILKFLKSYGDISLSVIVQLVKDEIAWGPRTEQELAKFINLILWKAKCNWCNPDEGIRVELKPGNFHDKVFSCAECGRHYDTRTFDYNRW